MTGRRKSARCNKAAGLRGKFVPSLLVPSLPSFELLSQGCDSSLVKVVKRCKSMGKRQTHGELSSNVDVNNSSGALVDSSALGIHSEVVFVNMNSELDVPKKDTDTNADTRLLNSVLVDGTDSSTVQQPLHLDTDTSVDNGTSTGNMVNVPELNISNAIESSITTRDESVEEFLEVDDELLNRVLNEDKNPSARNESWCRNRFNSWRKRKGMDCSKKIEEYDLRELGQILTR